MLAVIKVSEWTICKISSRHTLVGITRLHWRGDWRQVIRIVSETSVDMVPKRRHQQGWQCSRILSLRAKKPGADSIVVVNGRRVIDQQIIQWHYEQRRARRKIKWEGKGVSRFTSVFSWRYLYPRWNEPLHVWQASWNEGVRRPASSTWIKRSRAKCVLLSRLASRLLESDSRWGLLNWLRNWLDKSGHYILYSVRHWELRADHRIQALSSQDNKSIADAATRIKQDGADPTGLGTSNGEERSSLSWRHILPRNCPRF